MRFRVKLQAMKVHPAHRKAIDAFVKESVEEAARRWVRAAVEVIPVWSGASRATLEALASAVGEHIDIDVKGDVENRIALGRLFSRGGIERDGEANWSFFYETSLRYLIANETQNVQPRTHGLRGKLIEPTPYNFREAGNAAVEAYTATLILPLFKLKGTAL